MFGNVGVGQHRRGAVARGEDLGEFGAQRDRDRDGRHVAVQVQHYLVTMLGHRPTPRLVGGPAQEPSTSTVGADHGWLRDHLSDAHPVEEAHRARHALTGADDLDLDLDEAQHSTAQRGGRTRLELLRHRNQMHGGRALPAHAGR